MILLSNLHHLSSSQSSHLPLTTVQKTHRKAAHSLLKRYIPNRLEENRRNDKPPHVTNSKANSGEILAVATRKHYLNNLEIESDDTVDIVDVETLESERSSF